MDQRRRGLNPAHWVVGIVTGLIAACAAYGPSSAPSLVQITALQWIAEDADPVAALTTQPATCLKSGSFSAQARGGELLFNSPLLLGGQAAKAGLSCAACHQNGRGNPHFVFAGVTGKAGTADVTHGLFGPARADQVFNPVTIPDLALASGRTRVDREMPGTLEAFLSAQIIEEFEGSAPTPAMIAALASYIRALDAEACDPANVEPKSWRQELDRIHAGLDALGRFGRTDKDSSSAYALAIRASLGRLHARYAGVGGVQNRLTQISLMVRDGAPGGEIEATLSALEPELAEQAARSLYNPERLSSALTAEAD